ncbi:uncharacterized protein BJ171DRAFT_487345 [Polychytrium aggregatum]|uniref:uncharacterized protein n=1 Tax=Polychytrium aggregatum TaxID=110093 RepID=UPI0022FEA23F|nr:uncharacterized protein BJ171DRAFT_487345 [Polychytrium aggregatum]KAI9208795.1 hypothetical protein BJ171DRAFT_487345 [Polychytrium aggregatum]
MATKDTRGTPPSERHPLKKPASRTAPKKDRDAAHNVGLERIMGLTSVHSASIDVHPSPDQHTVAYAAGGAVVLYNYRKNKQVGYLISAATSGVPGVAGNAAVSLSRARSAGEGIRAVSCLAWSPEGDLLAVGESGHNPKIIIWDANKTTVVTELVGHKFGVQALYFSPNMKYLVSIGHTHDALLNVWDWKSGSRLFSKRLSVRVNALAFDSAGAFFVTVGERHAHFWNIEADESRISKSSSFSLIPQAGALGEHSDSTFVAVACRRSSDGVPFTYCITESGNVVMFQDRLLDKWVELKSGVAVCIDVSDKYILCGCTNGLLRLFEPTTLQFLGNLSRPHSATKYTAYDGSASSASRPTAKPGYPDVVAAKLDAANTKVVAIYNDRSLYVWDISDIRNPLKYRALLSHSDCVWGVEVVPSSGTSELPAPLDAATPQSNVFVAPSPPSLDQTSLPPNSFATYSSDGTVRFWNVDYTHAVGPGSAGTSSDSEPAKRQFSNGLVRTVYANREAPTVADEKVGIRTLKITPDGAFMATGDQSGTLRVYDMKTFDEIGSLRAHEAEILTIDACQGSERASFLATGSRDRLIHIFDMSNSFNLIQTLDDHSSTVMAIRFSTDGSQLVTCAADKSLKFRRLAVEDGAARYDLYHNAAGRSTTYDIDIEATQQYLTSVSQDRRLNIYALKSGKVEQSYKPDPVSDPSFDFSSTGGFIKVAVDPSGLYAVTSGSDKCIRVFDLYSGACIARMAGHSEIITGVCFTRDCSRIISTSGDGCIFVWRISAKLATLMRKRQRELTAEAPKATSHAAADGPASALESSPRADPTLPPAVNTRYAGEPLYPLRDEPAEAETPSPFMFPYSETGLPSWARSAKGDESEPSDVDAPNKLRIPNVPARGRWAQRIDAQGVPLFSERSDIANPVARLNDYLDRRYTIEVSGRFDGGQAPGDATPAKPIAHLVADDGTTVEDLGDAEASSTEAMEVDPSEGILARHGSDEEIEDLTALAELNPGNRADSGPAEEAPMTIGVPTKDLLVNQLTNLSIRADVGSDALFNPTENAESDSESSDTQYGTFEKLQLNNMTFDEYMSLPMEIDPTKLQGRQSISAKHLTSTAPHSPSRKALAEFPSSADVDQTPKPSHVRVSPLPEPVLGSSQASVPAPPVRDDTTLKIEMLKEKLVSMGVRWNRDEPAPPQPAATTAVPATLAGPDASTSAAPAIQPSSSPPVGQSAVLPDTSDSGPEMEPARAILYDLDSISALLEKVSSSICQLQDLPQEKLDPSSSRAQVVHKLEQIQARTQSMASGLKAGSVDGAQGIALVPPATGELASITLEAYSELLVDMVRRKLGG